MSSPGKLSNVIESLFIGEVEMAEPITVIIGAGEAIELEHVPAELLQSERGEVYWLPVRFRRIGTSAYLVPNGETVGMLATEVKLRREK